MKTLYKILGIILTSLILLSCQKKPVPPVISTTTPTEISPVSAVSGGNITDDGGAPISSKGICWNTAIDPTIDNNKTNESGESLSFTSNITQLVPSTLYYVRAYATNSAGTGYGKSVSFKTLGDKPVSNSQNASNIQLYSATLNGNVNPNSLSTAVTFEYGITTNYGSTITAIQSPLTGDLPVNVSADLNGLTAGTTYHFRIKAENSLGITFSNDMTLTTLGQTPSVTILDASAITVSSATLNGSVNPNFLPTTISFEWGINSGLGNRLTPTQNPLNGSTAITINAVLSGLTEGTKYYYRITATNALGTTNSIVFSFTTFAKPTITTNIISNITTTSALSGGNIISDFGSAVSEKGICWSTSQNPTTSDNKILSSSEGANFPISLTSLIPNSTYFVRAFATNSVGTGYGNEIVLKTYTSIISDIDGNQYYTVTIGNQLWMAQNLKTTKYRNGDLIGTTSPATLNITNESTPKYQWAYEGNESLVSAYGRYYTWYAATDSRNLCPTGWHVPSNSEWAVLEGYLINNGYGYEGSGNDIAKALASNSGWAENSVPGNVGNNQASNNSSEFQGIPVGYRYVQGTFAFAGMMAYWWSTTELDSQNSYYRYLNYIWNTFVSTTWSKKNAYSVRCLKD